MRTKRLDSEDKLELLLPEIWTEVLARLPVKTLVKFRRNCLVLLNPSIRKYLILPPCTEPAVLNFFPSRHGRVTRVDALLGFDENNDDYKVVLFNKHGPPNGTAAIYELSKGCWRTKSMNHMKDVCLGSDDHRLYWKGSVYWVPSFQHLNIVNGRFLVSFDFSTETLSYKELPGDWRKRRFYPFVLGESLAVYEEDYSVCNVYSYIWVMRRGDDDGDDQWIKFYAGKSVLYIQPLLDLLYVEPMDTLFLCAWPGVRFLHFKDKDNQPEEDELWQPCCYSTIKFMDTYVESLVLASGSPGQTVRPLSDLHNDERLADWIASN